MRPSKRDYQQVALRISDGQLNAFVEWYAKQFECYAEEESVVITCMCGRFHVCPDTAEILVNRCVSLNLIQHDKKNGTVILMLDT